MSKLLITRIITPQTVEAGGLVNQGITYRRYFPPCSCNKAIVNNGTSVSLNETGIYEVEVEATFTSAAAGDVTLQLFANGVAIDGAFATETITTADTEVRSVSFSTYVVVDQTRVLGINAITPVTITLVSTGTTEVDFTRVQVAYKTAI